MSLSRHRIGLFGFPASPSRNGVGKSPRCRQNHSFETPNSSATCFKVRSLTFEATMLSARRLEARGVTGSSSTPGWLTRRPVGGEPGGVIGGETDERMVDHGYESPPPRKESS